MLHGQLGRRGLLEQLLDTTQRTEYAGGFVGEVDRLVVLARSHLLECLQIADGDELLGGVSTRAFDSLSDLSDSLRFGIGCQELSLSFGLSV